MENVLEDITAWRERGDQVALATVVRAQGSTPRRVGAKMAINSRGEFVGSVSGGCVEGAVIDEARTVLKTGKPCLVDYGISDEFGWSVGLSCGGAIQVFIEKL